MSNPKLQEVRGYVYGDHLLMAVDARRHASGTGYWTVSRRHRLTGEVTYLATAIGLQDAQRIALYDQVHRDIRDAQPHHSGS